MRTALLIAFLMFASSQIQTQTPGTAEHKKAISEGLIDAIPPIPAQIPAEHAFFKTATTCQPDGIECIIPIDFDTWERVSFVNGSICNGANGWFSDDCSTEEIPLDFEYTVCGEAFNSLWVNTNGNITLDEANDGYVADGIPNTQSVMIAPFWADVDFSGGCGEVWIQRTASRFIATWLEVGYYEANCPDLLNTFQVVITDGNDPIIGVGNNTAFYYCDMNWTTGDDDYSGGVNGLGGFPAVVGINSGDLDAFAIIGNFNQDGVIYDGPLGENDGIDFLDNKFYLFDSNNCAIESSCSVFDLEVSPTVCDNDTYDLEISFVPAGVGPNGFVVNLEGEIFGPFTYASLGELSTVVIENLSGLGITDIPIEVFDVDNVNCLTDCFYDAPLCATTDCVSQAGTMPVGRMFVCADGTISVTSTGQILDSDDTEVYVLHTSATNALGDILVISADGSFAFDDLILETETTYYISSVVGNGSSGSLIDFNDACLSVSNGMEVVFLKPIEINIIEQCDGATGEVSLLLAASGGFPSYDKIEPYTFTGLPGTNAISVEFGAHALLSLGSFDAQTYSATVIDSNGCTASLTSDLVECIKLPIELSSFEVYARSKGNQLVWTTATETDNDYFKVEFASDATNFRELSRIGGAGNSTNTNTYEYLDTDAPFGTSYYRLTQVDFNGSSTRSEIKVLTRGEEPTTADFSFTNPVQETMNINFESKESTTIRIYSITGRVVIAEGVEDVEVKSLALNQLSAGVYLLEVQQGLVRTVEKFVKK